MKFSIEQIISITAKVARQNLEDTLLCEIYVSVRRDLKTAFFVQRCLAYSAAGSIEATGA
jgi:hypothetical protein